MKSQETIYISSYEQDTFNEDDDLFLCVRLQRSLGMNKNNFLPFNFAQFYSIAKFANKVEEFLCKMFLAMKLG